MEVGPAQPDSDPDNSWECNTNYYVCFKDCCQRIHQFCNEDTKRCQLCSTRSMYCGNDSLPLQCDAWCLQQKYSRNTELPECVSSAYWWSTYILLSILLFVVIGAVIAICRRLKVSHTNKDPKCIDSESSTDSLQLLQETQQKQCNDELMLIDNSDGGKHMTDRKEQDADFDDVETSNTEEEAGSSSKHISSRNMVFHNIPPTSFDTHPVSIHTGFTSTPNANLYSNN